MSNDTAKPATVPVPDADKLAAMTPARALYFMDRFRREEKLLGPNEQAAVAYVIAMLESAPAAPVVQQPEKE